MGVWLSAKRSVDARVAERVGLMREIGDPKFEPHDGDNHTQQHLSGRWAGARIWTDSA